MLPFCIASISGILILLVIMPLHLFSKKNSIILPLTLLFKGLPTLISAILCLVGVIKLTNDATTTMPDAFLGYYFVCIGMFLCVIADIAFDLSIIAGGIFFFLGHLSYMVYFIMLGGFSPISIPIMAILAMIGICYFYKYFVYFRKNKFIFILYASLLIINCSIAMLLPIIIGLYGLLPALAIILLVYSDFLLARNQLIKKTFLTYYTALTTYYSGQFLLAISIFLPAFLHL